MSNVDKSPELLLEGKQSQSNENQNNIKQQIPRILTDLNSECGCSNDKLLTHSNVAKHKMCILSSNKRNDVSSIAEKTFNSCFNLCHCLTPYGCTKQLLKDIDTKLPQFTLKDFCIIFLGDEDFKTTNNNQKRIASHAAY